MARGYEHVYRWASRRLLTVHRPTLAGGRYSVASRGPALSG